MKLKKIVDKIFLDNEEKKFIELNRYKNNRNLLFNGYIFLEITNNHFSLVHNTFLINDKKFKNKKFIGLWTPSMQRDKGFINFLKFIVKFFILSLEKKKWKKIYNSIGVTEIISLNDDFKTNFFKQKNDFVKKTLKIKKKKDYLNIKFKKILVGELMYDFYLRYFKKHQMNFDDKYEIEKISNYVQCYYKNLDHLMLKYKKKNIDRYIPWQACYIQCGVPIRFFLNRGVKVIGKAQEIFSHKYTKKNYLQSFYFEDLKKDFNKLKYKKDKIKKGLKSLKNRFKGIINTEINYLAFSPFDKKKQKKIKEDINIVIFLPDFVDSPHAFGGKFFFPDFYDWINETLIYLENFNNLKVAIKPHPNARYASRIFEEKLKKKYRNFLWLDIDISNHSIFEKKPIIAISPRGSVLFEIAYHNIVPIAIGRNYCMAYPFVYTAYNKKQYFKFLNDGFQNKLKLPKKNKNLIAECYYMNFINKPEYFETISSKIDLKKYRMASKTEDQNLSMLRKFNNGFYEKKIHFHNYKKKIN